MARPEFTCTAVVQPIEQGSPAGQHTYAYTITIVNTGDVMGQLVARRWLIRDALDRVQEVRGLAVVGQQPVLRPGERFEYTSWTHLGTPDGTMQGTFYCMTEDARPFEATVSFTLAPPAEGPVVLH